MSEHAVLHRDNSEQESEEQTWDVTRKIVILDDYRLPLKSSATGVGSGAGTSPTRPSVSFQAPSDPALSRAYWIAATAFSPLSVQQMLRTVETIQQVLASPSFVNQAGASMRAIRQAMESMANVAIPDANMLARQAGEVLSAFTDQRAAAQRAASAMMHPIDPTPTQDISGDTDRPINDGGKRSTDESISMQVAPVRSVVERIREIAELDEGWDSYGARKTTPVAVAEASQLLLRSLDVPIYQHQVAVDAAPLSDGGVIIEWDSPGRRFQVWIHGDGSRSGVVVEVRDGQDVNWLDVVATTDADVIAELQTLVDEPGHA